MKIEILKSKTKVNLTGEGESVLAYQSGCLNFTLPSCGQVNARKLSHVRHGLCPLEELRSHDKGGGGTPGFEIW